MELLWEEGLLVPANAQQVRGMVVALFTRIMIMLLNADLAVVTDYTA